MQEEKGATEEEKGATEDEMVEWHHRLNGHEFEQALGDSGGQGRLVRCNPWGCKESDVIWRLSNNGIPGVEEMWLRFSRVRRTLSPGTHLIGQF